MLQTLKLLRVTVPCMTATLLAACGGGTSGGSPSPTNYAVSATAGAGGTISPASAMVTAGGTTTFTVTPKSGYVTSGVSGCGGTLSGNTYTTGTTSANCSVTASFAAAFIWVSGPDTGRGPAVYGTQGTAAATNLPGPRDNPGAWTDASGNLWAFGGAGLDANGTSGILNDMWKFSPAGGQWTWVGGSDTVNATGVYGTQGVAAATNVPGARLGPDTWTDASGNLWLFGGWYNLGPNNHFNDLWKYSPASGEWTWVGGSSTPNQQGVYGMLGVAAGTNVPGGRTASATWTDSSGNLWMFGGEGYDSAGTYGWLNDLWEYSPASGDWTWVGGSDVTQATGVYGTQGVAAAANIPGARAYETAWTDASGNVWLFGGVGYDYTTSSYFYFNDLWKYSPSSSEWTWVGGSNAVNATGVYGTQGMAATTNIPGARAGAATWKDGAGNLWLFGGYWQNANGSSFSFYNDLWEYSPASGQWTWVLGSNAPDAQGVYGTQGTAAQANVPGARSTPAVWTDGNGNAWVFAGEGPDSNGATIRFNDLWKYPTQ
jgi:N-acetylneuraminic acid mutarotase